MKRLLALSGLAALAPSLLLSAHACTGDIERVDVITLDGGLIQDAGGDAGAMNALDASPPVDAGSAAGG
jgi:hypothetical protein